MQALSRQPSAQPLYASSATACAGDSPPTQLQMHDDSLRQRASQSIASEQLCVPLGVMRHDVPNQHDAKRAQSFAASCKQLCSVRFCAQSVSHDDDPSRHPASILQPAVQTSACGAAAGVAAGVAAAGGATAGDAAAGTAGRSAASAFDGPACRPRDPDDDAGGFVVEDGLSWLDARAVVTAAVVAGSAAAGAASCLGAGDGAAGDAALAMLRLPSRATGGDGATAGDCATSGDGATGGDDTRDSPPCVAMITTPAPNASAATAASTRPRRRRGRAAGVSTVRATVAIVPVVGAGPTPERA
jgi:hypothetical protein